MLKGSAQLMKETALILFTKSTRIRNHPPRAAAKEEEEEEEEEEDEQRTDRRFKE
jgi:hypothetical protein